MLQVRTREGFAIQVLSVEHREGTLPRLSIEDHRQYETVVFRRLGSPGHEDRLPGVVQRPEFVADESPSSAVVTSEGVGADTREPGLPQ